MLGLSRLGRLIIFGIWLVILPATAFAQFTGFVKPVDWGPYDGKIPRSPICTNGTSALSIVYYSTTYLGNYCPDDGPGDGSEGTGSHVGVDILHDATGRQLTSATEVRAIYDGVVVRRMRPGSGWGNGLVIKHTGIPDVGVVFSAYAHLSRIGTNDEGDEFSDVSPEAREVKKGQVIGWVGSTDVDGLHLHFQIDSDYVDKRPCATGSLHPFIPNRVQGTPPPYEENEVDLDQCVANHTLHPIEFVEAHLEGSTPPPATARITVNSNVTTAWTIDPGAMSGSGISGSHEVSAGPFGTVYVVYPSPKSGYAFTVESSDDTGSTVVLTPGEVGNVTITYTPLTDATEVPGTTAPLGPPFWSGPALCIMSKYLADRPPTLASTWSLFVSKGDRYPSGTLLSSREDWNVLSCEHSQGLTSEEGIGSALAVDDEVFVSVVDPDGNTMFARWVWDGAQAIPMNPSRESVVMVTPGGYVFDLAIAGTNLFFLRCQHFTTCFEQTLNRTSIGGGPVTTVGTVSSPGRLMTDGTHVYWREKTAANVGSIKRVAVGGTSIETVVDGLDWGGEDGVFEAVVAENGYVYFASFVAGDPVGTRRLRRAPTAGGSVTDLVFTGPRPRFTLTDGMLYYEETNPAQHCLGGESVGNIKKVNVSGGSPELVAASVPMACGETSLLVSGDLLILAHSNGLLSTVPTAGGSLQLRADGLQLPFHLTVDNSFLYLGNWSGINDTVRFRLSDFSKSILSWGRPAVAPSLTASDVYWTSTYFAISSCCGGAPVTSIIRVGK